MANETRTTIIGNLTADPELRYTQSGAAVANVTVASTERVWDKNTGGWKDADDTLFLRGSVWRTQAENVAESLSKGTASSHTASCVNGASMTRMAIDAP